MKFSIKTFLLEFVYKTVVIHSFTIRHCFQNTFQFFSYDSGRLNIVVIVYTAKMYVVTEAKTTSPGVYLSVPIVSCYLNKILYDNSFSYTPVNRPEHDVEIFKRVFSFFCFTPRRTIDSHPQMDTIRSFFLKLLPLMYCEKYD